ncbi:MAG: IS3 family transposase [Limnochordia bacterium]
MAEACDQGMTLAKACEILQLDERRIQRWIKLAEEGCYTRQSACDAKPHVPYNALTPEQKAVLEQYLAAKEYADASCRELSIRTLEQEGIYISHVSYWEAMKAKGINGPRGIQAKRLTARTKPETTWAKKPNQLWAWDITYLLTNERLKFFYLYAIIDRVSRKVVAWIVCDELSSDVAQQLWDAALLAEKLTDKPAEECPVSLSDRGSQMRSKSTKQFFKDLGITQLYSRPNTPNDNPHIEALFSTVKNWPGYPKRFETMIDAVEYFTTFFDWYNNEHYHTALNMITPALAHAGETERILAERQAVKEKTFLERRLYHASRN